MNTNESEEYERIVKFHGELSINEVIKFCIFNGENSIDKNVYFVKIDLCIGADTSTKLGI